MAAGLITAAVAVADEPMVVGLAELTGRMLDTRVTPGRVNVPAYRTITSPQMLMPFVFLDAETITVNSAGGGEAVELEGEIGTAVDWIAPMTNTYRIANGKLQATIVYDHYEGDFAFVHDDTFAYQRGKEIRPEVVLRDGDYQLEPGVDYTVAYSNNTNPGTGVITITGIGRYVAMPEMVRTFTILPGPVAESSRTLDLDVCDGDCRMANGVQELAAIAYNNVRTWPAGGDSLAAAAKVRVTPMFGVPGGVENWFSTGEEATMLATVAGEATVALETASNAKAFKTELLIGEEVVASAYLNLSGREIESRATVVVTGGSTMTAAVPDGQELAGEIAYRWYVYDPAAAWRAEGEYLTGDSFTPVAGDWEHKRIKLMAFDDNGVVGMEDFWCSKLPVLFIDTSGKAVESKGVEVEATMRIQGNDRFRNSKVLYDGPMTMHVRGNSTSMCAKKPYKLKLDKKADLLGMGKSKHWVLISNPFDVSLLRSKTAYDLSGEMGLVHMESQWVDVVMNGEYLGNYQLCEHIRVDENRVDIFDWEGAADEVADVVAASNSFSKAETKELETYLEQQLDWVSTGSFTFNSVAYVLADYGIDLADYDISGGYLFELDGVEDEVSRFYSGTADGRIRVNTKLNRPEFLKSNSAMTEYVQTMWNHYWEAVTAPDGYYAGVHYTEMASVDTMAAYWLVQTLMANGDYAHSRFAYKPHGERLQWGPEWDFDNSCGGRSRWTFDNAGQIVSRPDVRTGWQLGNQRYGDQWDKQIFFPEWVDDPYFVLKACEKMAEVGDYLDELIRDGGILDENIDYIFESGVANQELWAGKITYSYYPGTPYDVDARVRFDGEDGDVAWFKENLKGRIAWIRGEMSSLRRAVASLQSNYCKYPYVDAAEKFAFNFTTEHLQRPAEGEGEGATPDIMIANGQDLEVSVTLSEMTDPVTVDVYVNGISNGTCAVVGDGVDFVVAANRFTNVGGHRNMISLVVKDGDGERLATTYSLVTTMEMENAPHSLSNATVLVERVSTVATGNPIKPTVTITAGEGDEAVTLIEGVDYKVEYLNNVNPGVATVQITGLGNPSGAGEFPRGNWVGVYEYQFEVVIGAVSSSELRRQCVDICTNAVRKLARSDEFLNLAWNNAADWPQGGEGESRAVVIMQEMSGEEGDPDGWVPMPGTKDKVLVNAAGEGTKRVNRLRQKLYRFSLSVDSEVSGVGYFNLLDAVILPRATVLYLR